jgi:hypothetical protein
MAIEVERDVLARMLRSYGEDDLADRVASVSDDELARIGTLGGYYAFSEDAIALGGSMGGARALSLAALDVLDASGRELRRHHSQSQVRSGMSVGPDAQERRQDRELRRHAGARQVPADPRRQILDLLDPPAWDPAPAGATATIRRCHELRTKPLKTFTSDDLRFMIDQQLALDRLVGVALTRLRSDPLLQGDRYPGDLLASVLRVDPTFWEPQFDLEVAFRKLCESLCERADLEPELGKLITAFTRDHPQRSAHGVPD